ADPNSIGFQQGAEIYRAMLDATPAYAVLTSAGNTRLDQIEAGDAEMGRLKAELEAAQSAFDQEASRVSTFRKDAAKKLEAAMSAELAPLKMERAEFRVVFAEGAPSAKGIDDVAFEVATNPGAPSGPIEKVASGGELSRFLLALKVCLTTGAQGMTLIFDEIDRGVGGATADAVGRRLQSLAEGGQVLVVTHSPQVAALGQAQWQVAKYSDASSTLSQVRRLDALERVDEIARMLSGDEITVEAKAAAEALLSKA
ncbi:MAG: hypothetical protein AAF826_10825, partial [Pseudomonadota bacterium]